MLAWYQREALGPAEGMKTARGNSAPEAVSQIVKVPTLVIYGDADLYTRPASHRGLDAYVPDLTFQTLAGASHWLCDEQPATVNRLIRQFVARHEGQRAA